MTNDYAQEVVTYLMVRLLEWALGVRMELYWEAGVYV